MSAEAESTIVLDRVDVVQAMNRALARHRRTYRRELKMDELAFSIKRHLSSGETQWSHQLGPGERLSLTVRLCGVTTPDGEMLGGSLAEIVRTA